MRWVIALAGLCAVAGAAFAGWRAADLVGPPAPPVQAPPVAELGPVTLTVTPGWVPIGDARAPAGGQAFALRGLPTRAVVALQPPTHASLLPDEVRAELDGGLPQPTESTLGGIEAWTYGPLRAGSRTLSVTVVPTTEGVISVTCGAPRDAQIGLSDCAREVLRVSIAEGRVLDPAPDLAFRQGSVAALAELDRARVAGRNGLRGGTAGTRGNTAGELSRSYGAVAATLAPLASPGAPEAAVAALRDGEKAYGALGVAVQRRQRVRYVLARRAVDRADAALPGRSSP